MRRRYTVTMNKSKKKSKTREKKQAPRSGQTGTARVRKSEGDSTREKKHLGLARVLCFFPRFFPMIINLLPQ